MPQIDIADEDDNFSETFYPAQIDVPGSADSPIDEKVALLSVQDEQEGKRSCSFNIFIKAFGLILYNNIYLKSHLIS